MAKQANGQFATKNHQVGSYVINVRSSNLTSAETLIMVHGIGVSMKYYQRLVEELVHLYNIVAIDLPGYGESSKPPRALNLDQLAGVVADFIRQEGIKSPIIVGQSMGCQVAARLAKMKSIEVEKLILISPTVNITERSAPLQLFRLMQDVMREPLGLNIMILIDYLKFGPIRYLITQRYMINDQIEKVLAGTFCPVLLVQGSRDKIVPSGWISYLQDSLRAGDSVVIAGAPHNLQYTHPAELAAACNKFIQQ